MQWKICAANVVERSQERVKTVSNVLRLKAMQLSRLRSIFHLARHSDFWLPASNFILSLLSHCYLIIPELRNCINEELFSIIQAVRLEAEKSSQNKMAKVETILKLFSTLTFLQLWVAELSFSTIYFAFSTFLVLTKSSENFVVRYDSLNSFEYF